MDAARKRAQRRAVYLAKRRGDPQQSIHVSGNRCRMYREDGLYQAVKITKDYERKAELSEKKQQLLEARRLGGDCEQLDFEWGILEKEIDLLEHTAHVMKTDLIQRGLLVADEMKTQNMVLVDGKV
ncbi:hypothetical protein CTI12_AA306580 [Artemisia annua]|uniref:Uncharacterized protein n=1 Tax=Artemisia annua TaxID=35608 RepID=A0A2U1N4V5_ARTAN|nr:hypothetical protein CTI12_AA306580 [Artemisia annua]